MSFDGVSSMSGGLHLNASLLFAADLRADLQARGTAASSEAVMQRKQTERETKLLLQAIFGDADAPPRALRDRVSDAVVPRFSRRNLNSSVPAFNAAAPQIPAVPVSNPSNAFAAATSTSALPTAFAAGSGGRGVVGSSHRGGLSGSLPGGGSVERKLQLLQQIQQQRLQQLRQQFQAQQAEKLQQQHQLERQEQRQQLRELGLFLGDRQPATGNVAATSSSAFSGGLNNSASSAAGVFRGGAPWSSRATSQSFADELSAHRMPFGLASSPSSRGSTAFERLEQSQDRRSAAAVAAAVASSPSMAFAPFQQSNARVGGLGATSLSGLSTSLGGPTASLDSNPSRSSATAGVNALLRNLQQMIPPSPPAVPRTRSSAVQEVPAFAGAPTTARSQLRTTQHQDLPGADIDSVSYRAAKLLKSGSFSLSTSSALLGAVSKLTAPSFDTALPFGTTSSLLPSASISSPSTLPLASPSLPTSQSAASQQAVPASAPLPDRRHKRLLRNRVSAQQARERKRQRAQAMEDHCALVEQQNEQLESAIEALHKENEELRRSLQQAVRVPVLDEVELWE
eukprot:TRINITY_DN26459_c0_g1_i1.p1 TRINITY_DN26459_c0_g1~~TRINITY_DN26459_c0_g1_i1.p1  ORF type:complete len:569 (+),score=-9.23 TRINITY_DN26459_c0_g1_i1:151-1857(+)